MITRKISIIFIQIICFWILFDCFSNLKTLSGNIETWFLQLFYREKRCDFYYIHLNPLLLCFFDFFRINKYVKESKIQPAFKNILTETNPFNQAHAFWNIKIFINTPINSVILISSLFAFFLNRQHWLASKADLHGYPSINRSVTHTVFVKGLKGFRVHPNILLSTFLRYYSQEISYWKFLIPVMSSYSDYS